MSAAVHPPATSTVRRRFGRSRWAAIGAAVAVTLGAGGMLQANAAGGDASSPTLFIATTPCRLIDTRQAPATGGGRTGPLTADTTYTTRVLGTNGRCTIPNDATTLVMNVTAANQTAASYMTVYPAGSARPDTSSLNWTAGSGAIANAVTATVSPSGELSFYNWAGSVDLIADVVGYYTSAPLDNHYTKAQVDALIAENPGAIGPQGEPGLPGPAGADGAPGEPGPSAGTGAIAQFYSTIPMDDIVTIGVDAAVPFDESGPNSASRDIVRVDSATFQVNKAGMYRISYSVGVVEPGQLTTVVDGTPLQYSVVGNGTGSSPIIGDAVRQVGAGQTLQIVNSSSIALTLSGSTGSRPAVASLIIELVGPEMRG